MITGVGPVAVHGATSGDSAPDAMLDVFDDGIELLVARMVERFRHTIPTYEHLSPTTLAQVTEIVHANLTCFSACARDERLPSPQELTLFRDSAARRALEGLPLAGLLEAYRVGAQMTWDALRTLAEERGAEAVGLRLATVTMRYIDTVSGAVTQAYLDEFAAVAGDRESARRDFIDGALDGAFTQEELVARGLALGLDPTSAYVVCLLAVPAGDPCDERARAVQRQLRTMVAALPHGRRSLIVNRSTQVVAIVPARPSSEHELAERVERFVGRAGETLDTVLTAGIGRVHDDLSDIAGAYREAAIALAAARGGDSAVAVYGEVLVEELILREPSVARRLVQSVLDPLAPHPYLLETLQAYLRHGPSLPDVATGLCVHPNTVAYRLGRVRDLTGKDPRTPTGIAHLALALRSAELLT